MRTDPTSKDSTISAYLTFSISSLFICKIRTHVLEDYSLRGIVFARKGHKPSAEIDIRYDVLLFRLPTSRIDMNLSSFFVISYTFRS